jgi:2',3'-cyclic-nucleotide 2'-phosphodiesterase/3'-nucleotidase
MLHLMGDHNDNYSLKTGIHLRILATSDTHMHLTGWDARHDSTAYGLGLDQLAVSIRAARRAAPGQTVLLDNGDTLQGTPEADICAEAGGAMTHPWPAIADALGYDAMGLGNHDFDYGLAFLESVVGQMRMPVLCASLSQGRIAGVEPTAILTRTLACSDGTERPISIGVFSVLPPQTLNWNERHLAGRIAFDTGVTAAQQAVTKLRNAGADLIVALCHSGLSTQTDPGAENFGTQLAAQVAGIDAVILGHTHRRFPDADHGGGPLVDPGAGTVAGIPAVMPGFAARSLGVIDLQLAWAAEGWHVTGHAVALLGAPEGDTDPAISALAAPAIAATRAAMNTPLTTTGHDIHSYFTALQSETESALVARALTGVIARHVAGTPLADLPLIATVPPAAAGGHGGASNYVHVPAGVVLTRHAAMLCPYQNAIWAAVLTGTDLANWAERSAAYFAPKRGRLSLLVNPEAPYFSFDSLIGLEIEVDPFAPARFDEGGAVLDPTASRVRALRYNGAAIAPEARFLVAMTSYRGAGGGGFPGLETADTILRTDDDLTEAVRKVMAQGPLGDRPAKTAWRFTPDLGEQVIVETAPAAANHLAEIAQFDPHPIGLSDGGFLRLRVTL